MAFLRNLLATILGLIIFSVLLFFMFAGIVAVASNEEAPQIKSETILHFPMSGKLSEKAVDDPFLEAFDNGALELSHLDILNAIKIAKNDDRVLGIYLEPKYLAAGYSQLKELRNALVDFKASGKFIYAYGEYVSESDYYLASVADSLFLNPTGSLEFNGLSANITFYKGMFDKLNIKPEIFRVGEFKSAVEPFMRKDLSDENRLQYTELLNSMYGIYLDDLSESTDIDSARLAEISNQMILNLPADGKQLKMIHKVGYEDEIKSVMRERIGYASTEKLPFMKISKYATALASEAEYSSNKIAVIVAEGNIVMSGDDGIVGEKFAKEIRKARESSSVKAIVMRINSGGGSLTASDMIWRELELTKGKKPIIASMSTAAASGGYYIAMPADTIVANPNTITGSIGIFGLWFNIGEFLENKMGITNEVVKTGEYSDLLTITRPLTDGDRMKIQRGVNEGYELFTGKAAAARDMDIDELKAVAGGRVWSGEQAFDKGLVDVLGGFGDAVELAAQAAGIEDDYRVRYYPQKKPFLEEFIEKMSMNARAMIFGVDTNPVFEKLEQLNQYHGIQASMPGELTIH